MYGVLKIDFLLVFVEKIYFVTRFDVGTLAKIVYTQVQLKQAFYLKFNFDSPGVF
jgi:hypothetical protein